MILVDTSVWIDHFRRGNQLLKSTLEEGLVFCHPFIIGELACGNLGNRDEILRMMRELPQARTAENSEVMYFINDYKLYGSGLGWVDMNIIASSMLTQCRLWTLDNKLKRVALKLKISS